MLTVEGAGLARLATAPPESKAHGVLVQGLFATQAQLERIIATEAGPSFTVEELRDARPVAVLGDSAARLLAQGRPVETLVGEKVRLQSQVLEVVGVQRREDDRASMPIVYVPYPLASTAMAAARAL